MVIVEGRVPQALLVAAGTVSVEQLLGVRPQVIDDLRDRGVPTCVDVAYRPDWVQYRVPLLAESRGAWPSRPPMAAVPQVPG